MDTTARQWTTNTRRSYCVVFFGTGTVVGHVPWSARVWYFCRKPARLYHWFLAALTRALTDSDIAHVAIGFDTRVLEPSIAGDRLLALDPFCRRWSASLRDMYFIPVPDSWQWPQPFRRRKPALPTFVAWLSRGRLCRRRNDCVTTVVRVLRDNGVAVPDCVSPRQLKEWCIAQEFHHQPA